MRIRKGLKLRTIFGKATIIDEGTQSANFNKIITLNSSAAFMWQIAEGRDFDVKCLADALVAHYAIDEHTAMESAERMCREWVEAGLVTV